MLLRLKQIVKVCLQRDSHAKSQNKTEQKLTRCPSTDWIVLADIYSHYLVVGYIKNYFRK